MCHLRLAAGKPMAAGSKLMSFAQSERRMSVHQNIWSISIDGRRPEENVTSESRRLGNGSGEPRW